MERKLSRIIDRFREVFCGSGRLYYSKNLDMSKILDGNSVYFHFLVKPRTGNAQQARGLVFIAFSDL